MRCVFFFNDTRTPEFYPLSLHDALPISEDQHVARHALSVRHTPCGVYATNPTDQDTAGNRRRSPRTTAVKGSCEATPLRRLDRKSTRLNSSHANISYAVFCLKKKKEHRARSRPRRRACLPDPPGAPPGDLRAPVLRARSRQPPGCCLEIVSAHLLTPLTALSR